MMEYIKRICTQPTPEDREWFPELAGSGDWRGTLRYAWANYRDESFIRQYLSPALIRKMKLFVHADDGEAPYYRSEEHTSELQSLMRISYAVFCLKKKKSG